MSLSCQAHSYKSQSSTLKIVTYNTWLLDLPFNMGSRDIAARLNIIPQELAKLDADIIALQEVWSPRARQKLASEFYKKGYLYSQEESLPANWLLRGWLGNGLLVVSKYPLAHISNQNERVLSFSTFTRPDEYFAGKGAVHMRVQIPDFGEISFYNTHLGAVSFNPKAQAFDSSHEQSRRQQSRELIEFIRKTHEERPIILAGDFNAHFKTYHQGGYTEEYGEDYKSITCTTGAADNCLNLLDSYKSLNTDAKVKATASPLTNQYIGASYFYKNPAPEQVIDYIFVSSSSAMKVQESKIVLTEKLKIPNRSGELPLSDHYGVLTELQLILLSVD